MIRSKRRTPRRREAPRWSFAEWETANQFLAVRSEGACERCGDPRPYQIERHHRKRRRDGGDRLANVLLLCTECHRHVTDHPAEARRMGFIVAVHADVEVVPVFWRRREWFYLTDDGSKVAVDWVGGDAHE